MILGIQTIFCPDENQLNRNIESIRSLRKFLSVNKDKNFTVKFIGWAKPEFCPELIRTIDDIGEIKLMNKNYGKAYCVNLGVEKWGKGYEYLMNWDSDIIFELSENFFPRLRKMIEVMELKRKPWGMVSFQQKVECAHLPIIKQNSFQWKFAGITERVYWPDRPNGIAGGCLITPIDIWNNIGGYKLLNVYGGNDGWYLHDCAVRGLTYQVWDTFSVIHPRDKDTEYINWKRNTIRSIQQNGNALNINQLEEKIKQSEVFWDK